MMADLVGLGLSCPAVALSRSISASVMPAPNAPMLRKLRRVMPSQKRCLLPQSVNIAIPP
jgi:hypothetical protein